MKPSKLVKMLAREALNQALANNENLTQVHENLNSIEHDCIRRYAIFMLNGHSNISTPGVIAGGDMFSYRFIDYSIRKRKDELREHVEDIIYWRYESPFAPMWPLFKQRFRALEESIW